MENLINWLLNYAMDHGIGFVLTSNLPAFTPHTASAKRRMFVINKKYGSPEELPFAIAHEIGHIMDGDHGVRYYCSATIHDKDEHRANVFAIKLLRQYCLDNDIDCSNNIDFYHRFGIPERLLEE